MIAPPMDTELLANAIIMMSVDPYLRQSMGENGFAWREEALCK